MVGKADGPFHLQQMLCSLRGLYDKRGQRQKRHPAKAPTFQIGNGLFCCFRIRRHDMLLAARERDFQSRHISFRHVDEFSNCTADTDSPGFFTAQDSPHRRTEPLIGLLHALEDLPTTCEFLRLFPLSLLQRAFPRELCLRLAMSRHHLAEILFDALCLLSDTGETSLRLFLTYLQMGDPLFPFPASPLPFLSVLMVPFQGLFKDCQRLFPRIPKRSLRILLRTGCT